MRLPFGINITRDKTQPQADGGTDIVTLSLTDPRLAELLKGGMATISGEAVTPNTAMKVATAYRSTNIICGAIGSLPMDLRERLNDNKRRDADDHPLWKVLRKRPNKWQTPAEFKKLMQACVLLRGNGYALIVRKLGRVDQLIPLCGDMEVEQQDDFSLRYNYRRANGSTVTIAQRDIFHLRGMSLDGITGISVLAYAREALGLSLVTERHTNSVFKNGASVGTVIRSKGKVEGPTRERLKASLEEYRGAENAGKSLILEQDMQFDKIGMSSVDAQLLQNRELTHIEVAMFFGVPPHMLGLTSKVTSWGSGIEQQGLGFVAYTLQDWMTMWGESIERDLIDDADSKVYCRINPAGLIRGDIKTRYAAYKIGREGEWLSANDVRAFEDMDPIDGGDKYENPSTVKAGDGAEEPNSEKDEVDEDEDAAAAA